MTEFTMEPPATKDMRLEHAISGGVHEVRLVFATATPEHASVLYEELADQLARGHLQLDIETPGIKRTSNPSLVATKSPSMGEWQDWFAWYPVRLITGEIAWFSTVRRRVVALGPHSIDEFMWQYSSRSNLVARRLVAAMWKNAVKKAADRRGKS